MERMGSIFPHPFAVFRGKRIDDSGYLREFIDSVNG